MLLTYHAELSCQICCIQSIDTPLCHGRHTAITTLQAAAIEGFVVGTLGCVDDIQRYPSNTNEGQTD